MSHSVINPLMIMLVAISVAAGCWRTHRGGTGEHCACEVPEWYSKPTVAPGLHIGVGLGTDSDQRVAERKAIMQANLDLAKRIMASDNPSATPSVGVARMEVSQSDGTFCVYAMVQAKKD